MCRTFPACTRVTLRNRSSAMSAAQCSACTAPTVHYDMASVKYCEKLTPENVSSWVRQARGEKRRYFELVRAGTAPYNLTGKLNMRQTICQKYAVAKAAPPRIMFMGDSIVEELLWAYKWLVPDAVAHFYHVNALSSFEAAMNKNTADGTEAEHPWHVLASGRWDALVFGMGQMWRLLRTTPTTNRTGRGVDWRVDEALLPYRDAGNRKLYSPYVFHQRAFRHWISQLACLARRLGLPIVMVGSMPVDEQIVLLHPPKNDWDDFHELGLLEVMAHVEHEEERAHCAENAAEGRTSGLLFFHPSELAHQCPGSRCDGMHFSSNFPHWDMDSPNKDMRGWRCSSTAALYCPFVEDFLKRYLPRTLGLPAPARSCAPRPAPEGVRVEAARQCWSASARKGTESL